MTIEAFRRAMTSAWHWRCTTCGAESPTGRGTANDAARFGRTSHHCTQTAFNFDSGDGQMELDGGDAA